MEDHRQPREILMAENAVVGSSVEEVEEKLESQANQGYSEVKFFKRDQMVVNNGGQVSRLQYPELRADITPDVDMLKELIGKFGAVRLNSHQWKPYTSHYGDGQMEPLWRAGIIAGTWGSDPPLQDAYSSNSYLACFGKDEARRQIRSLQANRRYEANRKKQALLPPKARKKTLLEVLRFIQYSLIYDNKAIPRQYSHLDFGIDAFWGKYELGKMVGIVWLVTAMEANRKIDGRPITFDRYVDGWWPHRHKVKKMVAEWLSKQEANRTKKMNMTVALMEEQKQNQTIAAERFLKVFPRIVKIVKNSKETPK